MIQDLSPLPFFPHWYGTRSNNEKETIEKDQLLALEGDPREDILLGGENECVKDILRKSGNFENSLDIRSRLYLYLQSLGQE